MTVQIQSTSIPVNRVIKGYSRYANSEVIQWGTEKRLAFTTYLRQPYKRTGSEKVMLITPGIEYRPDLVAFDIYGFPDIWWKIMEVNGIQDILDFKAGRTIFLPSL
jgi:hypothetical protein